jgi:hypothetical protein
MVAPAGPCFDYLSGYRLAASIARRFGLCLEFIHLEKRSETMSANPAMSIASSHHFLRTVLWLDALSCVACGALQLALPGQLSDWLQLPRPLIVYTGVFLLAYAAAVAAIALGRPIRPGLVWLLIVGNLGWGLACLALLLAGPVRPSALGAGYILLQAFTVGLMAGLQLMGLRRQASRPAW